MDRRRFSLGFAFQVVLLVWVLELRDGVNATVSVVVPPEKAGICATAVALHGYKCHEFHVATPNRYVLNVIRMPEGRTGANMKGTDRPPVLIQHGILVDGITWMMNSPEQNLPMILADNGFDVWISNTRGTRFSRRHKSLIHSDNRYWDWCWDDMVAHDIPAMLDFVYKKTGKRKINYVGHSLGTLVMLASLSEGRLSDRLSSVALLSPIAYLSHMTTALGRLAAKSFSGEILKSILRVPEFNPSGNMERNWIKALCNFPGVRCYDLLSAFTGLNCCLNSTTERAFVDHEPQSTSTKNLVHLAQTVRTRVLRKYNYVNPVTNLLKYGSIMPPLYNLSNIAPDMPLFLSYGGRDTLSDVRDVQHLLDHLKFHNVDKLTVKYIKNYAHLDFIMASNANDVIYKPLMEFFKHHQK